MIYGFNKCIVNLYGGPGTGKSTTAARLFTLLKDKGYNTELVQEEAKEWAWENREIKEGDQICLTANQARRERRLFERCNIIVTDSPLLIGQYYEELFEKEHAIVAKAIRSKQDSIKKKNNIIDFSFFLNRVKPYNPLGRYQNEEEAKQIDTELKDLLNREIISYTSIDADNLAARLIYNKLLSVGLQKNDK